MTELGPRSVTGSRRCVETITGEQRPWVVLSGWLQGNARGRGRRFWTVPAVGGCPQGGGDRVEVAPNRTGLTDAIGIGTCGDEVAAGPVGAT